MPTPITNITVKDTVVQNDVVDVFYRDDVPLNKRKQQYYSRATTSSRSYYEGAAFHKWDTQFGDSDTDYGQQYLTGELHTGDVVA